MALLTFPFTPGYSMLSARRYAITTVTFADRSEQRFLDSVQQGRTLTYTFPFLGSAQVAAITSWWQHTCGPHSAFIAVDHTDGSTHTVRFAENALASVLGPGIAQGIPQLTFVVSS